MDRYSVNFDTSRMQTFQGFGRMSALPQKADIGASTGNVRLVPEAEVTEETFLSPLGVRSVDLRRFTEICVNGRAMVLSPVPNVLLAMFLKVGL